MAILEYHNTIVSLEIQSAMGITIDLKSKEFVDFLHALYKFHEVEPLKSLTLFQDSVGIYNYRVESKGGSIADYSLAFEERQFRIKLTTEGTWWVVAHGFVFSERTRNSFFVLVRKFNVIQAEIIFT